MLQKKGTVKSVTNVAAKTTEIIKEIPSVLKGASTSRAGVGAVDVPANTPSIQSVGPIANEVLDVQPVTIASDSITVNPSATIVPEVAVRNVDNVVEGVGDVYDPRFIGPVQWENFYRGHSAPDMEFKSAYAEYKGVDEAFRYVDELENTSRIDAYRVHAVSSQTSPYISLTSEISVAEHFAKGVNQNQAGYVTKFRFDARDPNKPQFNYENDYNMLDINPALGRTEAEYLAKGRIDPKHVVEQYKVNVNNTPNRGLLIQSADNTALDMFGRRISPRTQSILDKFGGARSVLLEDASGKQSVVKIVEGLKHREVKVKDLGRLQAATGNEFSLIRGPNGQRVLLQGDPTQMMIPEQYIKNGWKWSGHSHPYSVKDSSSDRFVLRAFNQEKSVIKSAADGRQGIFTQYEDWSAWKPEVVIR